MASIADAMSNMSGGNRRGGISGAMEGHREEKPEGEHEGGGVEGHLKALHSEMGGKHMHVHQHEGGLTSHHVKEDGKVEGPHEHSDVEGLKSHMDRFLSEEESERHPHEAGGSEGLI